MKRLIICADGTWGSPETKHPSNVVRLTRAIATYGFSSGTSNGQAKDEQIEQIVYYDWGIGTDADKHLAAITGAGAGIDKNIQDCYRFLVHNFAVGDELFFFGFSRGAYTVRSLAGLVRNAGILKSNKAERIPEAYAMYRRRGRAASPDSLAAEDFRHQHCHADRTPLAFIGVWETVGTLGIPSPFWGSLNKRSFLFHDTALSSSVKTARHALALDERRSDFAPCLWQPKTGVDLKQSWFVGSHSDVGGGNANTALNTLALVWLASEAQLQGLRLDPESDLAIMILSPADPPTSTEVKIQNSTRGLFAVRPQQTRDIVGSVHISAQRYWESNADNYQQSGRALKQHLDSRSGDWNRVKIEQ